MCSLLMMPPRSLRLLHCLHPPHPFPTLRRLSSSPPPAPKKYTTEAELEAALVRFRKSANASKPYLVFPNDTLSRLVKSRPRSLPCLSKVKGFVAGGKRLMRYGEGIVEVTRRYDSSGCEVGGEEGGAVDRRLEGLRPTATAAQMVRLWGVDKKGLMDAAAGLDISHAGSKSALLARLRKRLGRVNHKRVLRGRMTPDFPSRSGMKRGEAKRWLERRGIAGVSGGEEEMYTALMSSLDKSVACMTLAELKDECELAGPFAVGSSVIEVTGGGERGCPPE